MAIDDPFFNTWEGLEDVPRHVLEEIKEFFRTYKNLEVPKYASVRGWEDEHSARDIITGSIERFKDAFGDVATSVP